MGGEQIKIKWNKTKNENRARAQSSSWSKWYYVSCLRVKLRQFIKIVSSHHATPSVTITRKVHEINLKKVNGAMKKN